MIFKYLEYCIQLGQKNGVPVGIVSILTNYDRALKGPRECTISIDLVAELLGMDIDSPLYDGSIVERVRQFMRTKIQTTDNPWQLVGKPRMRRDSDYGYAFWADRQELLDAGEWASIPPAVTYSPLMDEYGNRRKFRIDE